MTSSVELALRLFIVDDEPPARKAVRRQATGGEVEQDLLRHG